MAELIIDSNYYNKLDIEGFSKMMNSPSYCYKFYWLEAIVQLISANRTEATYDEIINKMIANAWFPVQEYHIHLSGIYGDGEVKDNLEKAVSRLYELTQLPSNANEIQIMKKNKKLPVWEDYFGQFANNQFMMYEMIYEKAGLLLIKSHRVSEIIMDI